MPNKAAAINLAQSFGCYNECSLVENNDIAHNEIYRQEFIAIVREKTKKNRLIKSNRDPLIMCSNMLVHIESLPSKVGTHRWRELQFHDSQKSYHLAE